MGLVSTQDKVTLDPGAAAPIAKSVAQAKARDRMTEFLNQSTEESPDQLAGKYGQLFDSGGGFSFGDASALGGDQIASGAINARMRDLLNKNVGFQRANLLRGSVGDYSNRMDKFQAIHSAAKRQRDAEALYIAKKKAAAKAKKSGVASTVLGTAGAIVGGIYGGPAGAMAGAGAGSAIGSQVG